MIERERKYVDLYFEDVLGDRYGFKCAFPVRRGYHTAVQYWLVHASDHERAFELMHDEIVKLNELLLFRDFDRPGALPGMGDWELDEHRAKQLQALEHAVLRTVAVAQGQTMRAGAIREALLDEFFGNVKWGAYAKAVKNLLKDDKLLREQRKGAALPDDEFISMPPVAAPTGTEAASVVPIRAA